MRLTWTQAAVADLERLYGFLASASPPAAAKAVQLLVKKASHLPSNPRIGVRLDRYRPREVRRVFVGNYEIRYELSRENLHILRIWHGREHRS